MNLIEIIKTHTNPLAEELKLVLLNEEEYIKCNKIKFFTFGSTNQSFLEYFTIWYEKGGWDFVNITKKMLLSNDWELYEE